ncbi:Holliday junction branch migration DNA helicase RuvB [Patescibacteria group bacterium]
MFNDENPLNRVIDPNQKDEDQKIDFSLRPKILEDFVGQRKIKDHLNIGIQAAKQRGDSLDHILLYGGPGLGKTTMANIIAKEMDSSIKVTSGPAIERAGDLAAILTNLENGDILFIDEIHRLNKLVEEILYPAMEEYVLDIIVGKGPSARTLRLDLPKFTIIGATTRMNMLSSPLRGRFGNIIHFNFYEDKDIEKIISRSANILDVSLESDAVIEIAKRARKTPRIANRLLKRARDYAEVKGDGIINLNLTCLAMDLLDIDNLGLDQTDRMILEVIIDKFSGGPVGLNTIAAATSEEISTIEEIYEPFLIQCGFLDRTPRGRVVTDNAYEHLGKS